MARPRALIAVAEERGIIELVRCLSAAGYEIVVAGDIGRALALAGLDVLPVEFATRHAPILGDRVAALHPSLMAGINARRDSREDMAAIAGRGVPLVDIVVAQVPGRAGHLSARHAVADQLAGGPYGLRAALLQAAATNWRGVICMCDPNDYGEVSAALGQGGLDLDRRRGLAIKALGNVVRYHKLLASQFAAADDDDASLLEAFRTTGAHAAEAAEAPVVATRGMVAVASGGEKMFVETVGAPAAHRYEDATNLFVERASFRNLTGGRNTPQSLIDADLGWSLLRDLPGGQRAVLCRMGHVCAVASVTDSSARAILRALAGDPNAATGGTLVVSGNVDVTCARALLESKYGRTLSTLAAAGMDEEAAAALREAGQMRLLQLDFSRPGGTIRRLRPTRFGVLIEELAEPLADDLGLRRVGNIELKPAMLPAARVAVSAARHSSSAAAVIAEVGGTLGICAGQAHVRDAIQIAVAKARRFGRPGVLAVDCAIDRADALTVMARAGVVAVVQPGPTENEAEIGLAADGVEIALLAIDGNWHRA